MKVIEVCAHCDNENHFGNVPDDCWVLPCKDCGKVIPLCDKCASLHPDGSGRPCDDCIVCDLANFMNYLRGNATVEDFLASLNPSLTDMTTGVPEGETPTLQDYLDDTWGDAVNWDVKYWDIYRMVSETFLNAESSEQDCRDFVEQVVERNKA